MNWEIFPYFWASLVIQMVKNLLAMQETWVRSLDQEDPLDKVMATHFSILAWKIPWAEEPCRLQSVGSQRVGHSYSHCTFSLSLISNYVEAFLQNWNSFFL